MDRVAAQLRACGERMTLPRRAVLSVLGENRELLTVDQVAERVATFAPTVHLTSVYRALETLGRHGVVRHVHLGHGNTAYHLVDSDEGHAHVECRACGEVWDLPAHLLQPVAEVLARDLSFEFDATHVALSGVCSNCRGR